MRPPAFDAIEREQVASIVLRARLMRSRSRRRPRTLASRAPSLSSPGTRCPPWLSSPPRVPPLALIAPPCSYGGDESKGVYRVRVCVCVCERERDRERACHVWGEEGGGDESQEASRVDRLEFGVCTRKSTPATRNPKPETRNPGRHSQPQTANAKAGSLNGLPDERVVLPL